jgi:hypothetical protein
LARYIVRTPFNPDFARERGVATQGLEAVLATVAERIAKYRTQSIGEQDTKATLIAPVLRGLGWNTEDLEDVKLEYKRLASDNPVDYALFLLREPRLFIEAKALGANLDDHKWTSQILAYATVAGVEWIALSDGNDWRIYNSHAVVPVDQKLFRAIRITDPATHPAETLRLLSKAGLQDKIIETLWKTEVVDRRVKPVLDRLFAPEIAPDVLRLIHRRVPDLSLGDVRASLGRARIGVDYPAIQAEPLPAPAAAAVAPPPLKPPVPAPATIVPTAPAAKAVGEGTPWRHVTLAQLIEAGLVRLPFAIEHRYRGVNLDARIDAADRIVFVGVAYDSLSIAGGHARASVPGKPTSKAIPQTNGWTFWEYRADDGSLRQLDALRQELFDGKVVPLPAGRRTG